MKRILNFIVNKIEINKDSKQKSRQANFIKIKKKVSMMNNAKENWLLPHPCGKHCTCQDLSTQHEQVCSQQAGLHVV